MKCDCLMTHVGYCVCKPGGRLLGKVQVVPASLQGHLSHGLSVNRTLGLLHKWPLPAGFSQRETLLASRRQVWARDPTAPTPNSSHQLGTLVLPLPTFAALGPAARDHCHRPPPSPSQPRHPPSPPRYGQAGIQPLSRSTFSRSTELILIGRSWVMCPFLSQSMWWGWSVC